MRYNWLLRPSPKGWLDFHLWKLDTLQRKFVLLASFSASCIHKASFVSLNHSTDSENIMPLYILYDRPVGLECYKHHYSYVICPHGSHGALFIQFHQALNLQNPQLKSGKFWTWILFAGLRSTCGMIMKGYLKHSSPFRIWFLNVKTKHYVSSVCCTVSHCTG
jgi:hypothetical protein